MTTVEASMEIRYRKPIPPIDLCVTDLEKRTSYLSPKQKTMKFSKLILAPRFDSIRDRVTRIYETMESNYCYCPLITAALDDGVYLRWSEDTRFVIIIVLPDIPFSFARGKGAEAAPCQTLSDDKYLWTMLPFFARFVSPRKVSNGNS